jgi:ATP-binding cassette, subfamily C, bacterial
MKRILASLRNDKKAIWAFARLLAEAPRQRLVILLLLMLISAFTEGIGLVLLVPLITVAGRSDQASSRISSFFEGFGLSHQLGVLLILFVVLIALRALLQYVLEQVRQALEYSIVDGLREKCFSGLMNAEWRWMVQGRASDYSSLLITNIARIGTGFTSAIMFMASSLVAIAYLAVALILSWQTALVVLIGGAMVIIGFSGLRQRVTELGLRLGLVNKNMHLQVQEGMAAIRLTKLTGNEVRQTAAFTQMIDTVRKEQLAYSRNAKLGQAALQVGGAVVLAASVYIGLQLWHVPIPILLPLLLISIRLVPMFSSLQQAWHYWLHAVPALAEIRQLLFDLAQNAEPSGGGFEAVSLTQAIELHDVSLLYNGRSAPALNAVSLRFAAFNTTAVIGSSGAGKSSLADIVTGLIEPNQGALMVDGVAITGPMRKRWRHSVSYVQQDAFLFHSSVRSNLLWASPQASEAELHKALITAAADFVLKMPDGLDTIVGDGGVRLSGGERQRIALARALLRTPALLVLDEATSALDPENENAIRRAIANLRGRLTVIIIGHRRSMLADADQVIELRNGRVLPHSQARKLNKTKALVE